MTEEFRECMISEDTVRDVRFGIEMLDSRVIGGRRRGGVDAVGVVGFIYTPPAWNKSWEL